MFIDTPLKHPPMATRLNLTVIDGESSSSPISTLPMHIILTEILPRFPTKSLARFKSVCKTFNSLISSPDFTFTGAHRLLVLPGNNLRVFAFDLDSPASPALTAFGVWEEGSISVVGSCNGLLCIVNDYASRGSKPLILLNPTSQIYKEIPTPKDVIVTRADVNFGLGFDEENQDYKIVVVSDNHGRISNNIRTRNVNVYSLRTNSWRLVDHTFPHDSMEKRHGGVLIDNHLLHWMFWSPAKRKRRIGCFDVRSEQWKDDVMLPDYYYDPRHRNYLLDFGVVDDGCLCSSFENLDDSTFDVWVMKEYGVKDSWIKLLTIPVSIDLSGGVMPIVYRSGSPDEVLVRQRHQSKLLWCNSSSNAVTRAEFRRLPDFSGLQPYICKGSIVSIPGGRHLGESRIRHMPHRIP